MVFNGPAGVQAAELWKTLIADLGVSPTDETDGAFVSGLYSMEVTGEWDIRTYSNAGLDYGLVTMPAWEQPTDQPVSSLGGQSVLIPAVIEEPILSHAVNFVNFSASREQQLRYTQARIGTSARTDLFEDPFFDTADGQRYRQAIDDLRFAKQTRSPEYTEMTTLIGNALQEIILTGRDTQEALDEAAARYQRVYDDAMAAFGE